PSVTGNLLMPTYDRKRSAAASKSPHSRQRGHNLEQTRAAFREMELLPSYTPRPHGSLIFRDYSRGWHLWLFLSRSLAVLVLVYFCSNYYSSLLKSHSTIS